MRTRPRIYFSAGYLLTGALVAVSVSGKEWRYPPEIQVDEKLLEAAGGSSLIAKLLIRRGISTASEATVFLDPAKYVPSSPNELPNMGKAVERIKQAIEKKEHVTVYGDYDVDGVTGTSVLVTVLRKLGAHVDYYIPNRAGEGYGLNLKAVSILASKRRSKLIITCDCGVSNFAEINFAKSLGVETIVADHHTMPEMLPPAVAILHPKLLAEGHNLYNLPGVGVAYKLGEALLVDQGLQGEVEKLLDFVTLGMIADLVPLVQENRYLVQIGLPKLAESQRPGLKALLSQVRTNNGTDMVGFGLAPRINAVGRLADANLAVELMTTDDQATAEKIALQLQTDNARRQELCEQILAEAEQMLSEDGKMAEQKAIAIYKEGWHHGVVGIVASRLVEKFHKPVFIGELDADEQIVKGSARGVEGIDLYEALKANETLLSRWGGHKMAAGFAVEAAKADSFCRAITDTCNRMLAEKSLRPVLEIDALVSPGDVSMDLVEKISPLAPFGMANKKPVLSMKRLTCLNTRSLGKEGKHSRIMLQDDEGKLTFESVFWNSKNRTPTEGQVIDIAFNAEINSYNGVDRLQLVLCDWLDPDAPAPLVVETSAARTSPTSYEYALTSSSGSSQVPMPGRAVIDQSDSPAGARSAASDILPDAQSQLPASRDHAPNVVRPAAFNSVNQTWKDLREHNSPQQLLEAAHRKLGDKLGIFSETLPKLANVSFLDRIALTGKQHILLWQVPPSAQVFRDLLASSEATHVYLVRSPQTAAEDASAFLKKLLGLVRFAANKRDGKAEGGKLEAALGTTRMAMALGLSILRRLTIVDWFSEEGVLYLDLLGEASGSPESLPEFRQLSNSLKEIQEFRSWCVDTSLKELQLALAPNHIELNSRKQPEERLDELDELQHATEYQEAVESISTGQD